MPGQVSVLDFGGQYGHLIARRMRELGYQVYHYPVDRMNREALQQAVSESRAVILSGGPLSVWQEAHDHVAELAVRSGKPALGICYGHQLLAKVLGGEVGPSPRPEFGRTELEILESDPLFQGMSKRLMVWMSHNDAVLKPPPGARVLARSPGSPVAAMRLGMVYGVQWHPEVHHTEHGRTLLGNWAFLAGLEKTWTIDRVLELVLGDLREQVKGLEGRTVLSAVSGGVDSTVATVLVARHAPVRLVPVMIEHGLHPEGWVEESVGLLASAGIRVWVIDASDRFLDALRGVVDPEEKRRVIAGLYFEVLREEMDRHGAEGLVQGTIYPDIIESGAMPGADRIKTHHNVALRSLPGGGRIIEPLRWLYKDEVRRLGRLLGVPERLLSRQPVPGPGLAVRVEGEVTRDSLEVLRRADRIVREELERRGLHRGLWQYFAVLTRSRATGVKGDRRAYGYVVVVRAVESMDAMTASPARLPWEALEAIAGRITGEIAGVTRVVYDITTKPPATIEWE